MPDGLVLDGVSFRRGALSIVDCQSLKLPRGEALAITGANGVGKSTVLHLCAGLLKPQQGEVTLDGHAAHAVLPSQLARAGVRRAVVFQRGGLVAQLSVLENVMLPLRYHADVLQLDDDAIESRARRQLAALAVVAPDIHALPGRLSLGIRKRVAFARALAIEPQFAFFDDPDAGLDHDNAERIIELLLQYRDDDGVTMVVTSNHGELLRRIAVPVVELRRGHFLRPDLLSQPPPSLV